MKVLIFTLLAFALLVSTVDLSGNELFAILAAVVGVWALRRHLSVRRRRALPVEPVTPQDARP